MKYRSKQSFALVVLAGVLCVGCNVGNAPMGETPEETQARLAKMTLEQRAGEIKKLGQPGWMKADSIKKMYAKEGKEAPPEVLAGLDDKGGPGAPGAPGGAPSGAPPAAGGGK